MAYEDLINDTATKYQLDPDLLSAVVKQESGGNPQAVGKLTPHGRAVGLMQLMPATAKDMGVTNRSDPAQNLDGGAKYLRQMLDKYNGDERLALAAYNAGPDNVDKYKDVPPFPETQNYVSSILSNAGRTPADPIQNWIDSAREHYSDRELYDYFKKGGAGPRTLEKYFPGVTPLPAQLDSNKSSGRIEYQPTQITDEGLSPAMSLATWPGRMLLQGGGDILAGARNLAAGNVSLGGHQLLSGAGETALPEAGPAIFAHPGAAALAALFGVGANMLGNQAGQVLGLNPEQAQFAGDIASLPAAAYGQSKGARGEEILRALFSNPEVRKDALGAVIGPARARSAIRASNQVREALQTPESRYIQNAQPRPQQAPAYPTMSEEDLTALNNRLFGPREAMARAIELGAPTPQAAPERPTLSDVEIDELNRRLGLQLTPPEVEIKTGRGTAPGKTLGGGAPTTRLKGGGPVGKYVEGGSLTPEGQAEEARQAAAQQMQGAYQQPLNLQEIRQRLNLPPNQPVPANWAKPTTPPTPGTPGTEGLRPENVELAQNTQAIREHWAHRVAGEMLKDGIKNLDELSPIRQREYAANAGYDRGVQRGLSKEMKPIIQDALDTFWRTRGRR